MALRHHSLEEGNYYIRVFLTAGTISAEINMNKFKNNASDILRRMKLIEEFCDVSLISDDGAKILAQKVVLASASTLFREIFLDSEEDKDYQEVNMKDVESKYMNAMVELINNGETEIKLIKCEEFINILKHYCVASKESLSEDKEIQQVKQNMKNKIMIVIILKKKVIKKL